MRRAEPPRSATWILGCLLPRPDRDAVIGDLAEEYALRAQLGSRPNESWWYWTQISRSVPPLLWAAIRRGRWLGALGAALAAYGLVTLIESAGGIASSRLLGRSPLVDWLISLAITLSAMALGGYVAARLRRGAAAALAIISALVVIRFMVTTADIVPLRYQVPWLVLCPLTALAGGALVRRQET